MKIVKWHSEQAESRPVSLSLSLVHGETVSVEGGAITTLSRRRGGEHLRAALSAIIVCSSLIAQTPPVPPENLTAATDPGSGVQACTAAGQLPNYGVTAAADGSEAVVSGPSGTIIITATATANGTIELRYADDATPNFNMVGVANGNFCGVVCGPAPQDVTFVTADSGYGVTYGRWPDVEIPALVILSVTNGAIAIQQVTPGIDPCTMWDPLV